MRKPDDGWLPISQATAKYQALQQLRGRDPGARRELPARVLAAIRHGCSV